MASGSLSVSGGLQLRYWTLLAIQNQCNSAGGFCAELLERERIAETDGTRVLRDREV